MACNSGAEYASKILRSQPWHGWPLCNICVTNDHGYVPLVVNTSRSFPHSWLITGFVTILIWLVLLVEQELLTLPEHLRSPPAFSGVRVTRSLVLGACFVEHYLSFWTFSFGRCVVCSSSTYGFWLFLWYFQTLLTIVEQKLLTLPEHPSSGSFLVRFVLLHLYIYAWCFVDHCVLLLLICIVWPSSNYGYFSYCYINHVGGVMICMLASSS